MKLSARNQLKGRIVEVQKGATTAHVRIDLGHGLVVDQGPRLVVPGDIRGGRYVTGVTRIRLERGN